MAKVILLCGKICCGKTTYAAKLRHSERAVILSADEITLLFGQYLGHRHDEFVAKAQTYLLNKAVEIVHTGINVILDWGFWTQSSRHDTRKFFAEKGIDTEMHYLHLSDEEWHARIEKRNAVVSAGDGSAYFIDENLLRKCLDRFEAPAESEVDIFIKQ